MRGARSVSRYAAFMTSRQSIRAIAALAATLVVAGCARTGGATDNPSSTPSMSSSAPSTSSSSSTLPAGPAPSAGSGSTQAGADSDIVDPTSTPNADQDVQPAPNGSTLILTAARPSVHGAYDRVVLQFSGAGSPGWSAQYATSAATLGKGDPIKVAGAGMIDLMITGTTYPQQGAPALKYGSAPGVGVIPEIYTDGWFEGTTHVVLGTAAPGKPFRVFAASNPARLVIDVFH